MGWRCSEKGYSRVAIQEGVDVFALDSLYPVPVHSGGASALLPGMEVVFLRSRFTPTSPPSHLGEDAVEAVVEARKGKATTVFRLLRVNGIPASGLVSVRDDVSERFFLKRKAAPGDGFGVFLDRDRLPWRLETLKPPPPLRSAR